MHGSTGSSSTDSSVFSAQLTKNFNAVSMPDDKGQNELGTTFSVNVPSFSPYYLNRLLLESLLDNYVNSLCGARNMQAS